MSQRPLEIDDLPRVVSVSDPTWRPGRDEILFTRKSYGEKFKVDLQLWAVEIHPHPSSLRSQALSLKGEGDPPTPTPSSQGRKGQVRQLTSGDSKNSGGRWAPDGSGIAFLSDRKKPGTQLFFLPADGGEARPLTDLPEGSLFEFKWSPDSKWIAFVFRETHPDFSEKGKSERKEAGLSELAPKVIETAYWRRDGEGFFLDQRRKVYLLDVEAARNPLDPPSPTPSSLKGRKGLSVLYEGCPISEYTFDWAPDSKGIVLARTFAERPWIEPIGDELVLVDLDGQATTVPGLPKGEKFEPRFSPSGKQIAYLGNDDPNDHRTVNNLALFVCPVEGGSAENVTHSIDLDLATPTLSDTAEGTPVLLQWKDEGSIYAQWAHHGTCHFGLVDLGEKRFSAKTEGKFVLSLGPVREDGKVACIHSSPTEFPEIGYASFEEGAVRSTDFNGALADEVELFEPVEHYIHASDGYPVHLWELSSARNPPSPTPSSQGRKGLSAAILMVHGGPQCQYGWAFFFEFQMLAGRGYQVVYSNPRGSKGYGKAHCEAIAGKWGQKDWIDIEACKDWMKDHAQIDSDRIGIEGGSYGGYMVNWAVGHTGDFAAAITDRCVSNLVSKSLNTDYPYHPGTYWKGAPYQGAQGIEELWRDSPIAYFENVKTPMLVIHSEGDLRCHIEQGEQVYTALQELGVPCRFVRYPSNTSHGMSRAGPVDLRMHRLNEIASWWEKWLGKA